MINNLKRKCALTLIAALIASCMNITYSDAAIKKPKLSIKSITIHVSNSKKVKILGSKIKKTKWTIKNKKIVSLSSKKKTSVKIKGKKIGSTTVVASVKVGSKNYKLNCKVKVAKKKATPTSAPTVPVSSPLVNTSTPTNTPTVATSTPTLRPLVKVSPTPVVTTDPSAMATTPPKATVNPAGATVFNENFDGLTLGTTITGNEEGIMTDDIGGVTLRMGATASDYIKVVSGGHNDSQCIEVFRNEKFWQGALVDVTSRCQPGGTYTLTAWAKLSNPQTGEQIKTSRQLKMTEDQAEWDCLNYSNDKTNTGIITDGSKWSQISVTFSIPDDMYSCGVYFETNQGFNHDSILLDDITLTQTGTTNRDETIPSLLPNYSKLFGIFGVGAGKDAILGVSGSSFITSQFNAYTSGNEMKPDAVLGDRELLNATEAESAGYIISDAYKSCTDNMDTEGNVIIPTLKFDTVDQIMKRLHEKGLKLRFHTLIWHQQMPTYFFQTGYKTAKLEKYNASSTAMDTRIEYFITNVMEHILKSPYADCIYSIDVVNEYLHSHNSHMQDVVGANNPITYWEKIYKTTDISTQSGMTVTPSYVKYAFKIAHEELVKNNRTDIALFYNDYNSYSVPEDIVHLVDFINSDGKICDGIGMQAHLSMQYPTVDKWNQTLEFFRANLPKEIQVQITELDITIDKNNDKTELATDQEQAARYKDIMRCIIDNKKAGGNITAVILWSLYDGVSWRSTYTPCIFNGLYSPKSAFYAISDLGDEYNE